MSNYEHKDGSGSLWVNDKKTAENQPDYKEVVSLTARTLRFQDGKRFHKAVKRFCL